MRNRTKCTLSDSKRIIEVKILEVNIKKAFWVEFQGVEFGAAEVDLSAAINVNLVWNMMKLSMVSRYLVPTNRSCLSLLIVFE